MQTNIGSWEKFADVLQKTPPGNNGNIGQTVDVYIKWNYFLLKFCSKDVTFRQLHLVLHIYPCVDPSPPRIKMFNKESSAGKVMVILLCNGVILYDFLPKGHTITDE